MCYSKHVSAFPSETVVKSFPVCFNLSLWMLHTSKDWWKCLLILIVLKGIGRGKGDCLEFNSKQRFPSSNAVSCNECTGFLLWQNSFEIIESFENQDIWKSVCGYGWNLHLVGWVSRRVGRGVILAASFQCCPSPSSQVPCWFSTGFIG